MHSDLQQKLSYCSHYVMRVSEEAINKMKTAATVAYSANSNRQQRYR